MGTSQETQTPYLSGTGNFGFSDKTIRKKFISKVFSILSVQLLITLFFVTLATFHVSTRYFLKSNPSLNIIVMIVTFGVLVTLTFWDDLRRKNPTNYVLLFVFTIAESLLVASTTTYFKPEQVFIAIGLTTLICFALTLFALQTKIDFTIIGGFLLVAAIVLMVVSIVAIFFPTKLITIFIASAGSIIFCLYFIYDTQLMIGGEHKYSISPEEYIFAALNLYVDIINIFLHIVAIIAGTGD